MSGGSLPSSPSSDAPRRDRQRRLEPDDLAERVHPGVGPARGAGHDRLAVEGGERVLEAALHGPQRHALAAACRAKPWKSVPS
jgi:hypothetical protein